MMAIDRRNISTALWQIAIAALGYSLAHAASFLFPDADRMAIMLLLTAGVSLAAFLLVQARSWPFLALALFVVGSLAVIFGGHAVLPSLGLIGISLLESWICALVIRRSGPSVSFTRLREVVYLGIAAVTVNGAAALLAAALALSGPRQGLGAGTLAWWLATGFGMILLAPLLVSYSVLPRGNFWEKPWQHFLDLGYLAIVGAYTWFCFDVASSESLIHPQPYLLVLVLLWPALRKSSLTLGIALFLLTAIIVTSRAITEGPSPLFGDDLVERLQLALGFLAALSFTSYMLAAAFAEVQRERENSHEASRNLETLGDNIPEGLVYQLIVTGDGRRRYSYISRNIQGLSGIDRAEIYADPLAMRKRIHPEDETIIAEAETKGSTTLSPFTVTVRFLHSKGMYHWVMISSSPRLLADGSILWNGIMVDISRQRQIEDELRASKEQYRVLLERAADGIFISGPDGCFTEINAAGHALVGASKGALMGKCIEDLIDPEDLAERPVARELLERGLPVFAERRLLRDDGSPVSVEISSQQLEDHRTIAILRDISERKWSERKALLRLRLSEVASLSELDGLIQVILDEAEAATASVIGFYHFIDEDQKTLTLQVWSTNTLVTMCTAEGKGSHYDINEAGIWVDAVHTRQPVIHNDYASLPNRKGLPPGHAPVVRELVIPIIRNGLVVAILGVGNKAAPYDFRDIEKARNLADLSWEIVERKRTMIQLKESETRFSQVFRGSPLPTVITKAESGDIVDVNDAFIEFFQYSKEEVVGKNVGDIGIYEDIRQRAHLVDIFRGGKTVRSWEPRFRKKDGQVIDTSTAIQVIHLDGETLFMAQIQDLTERKAAEDRIAKSLTEKEVLLRELYHRANNNMQVITALLDFQAQSLDDDRFSRAIEETQDRIGSLALVNRKLFEAQDLSHVNFREYVLDLLGMLAQNHKKSSSHIAIVTELEDVLLLVDTAIPCGLILNELISNAYRHAFPGGRAGTLRIALHKLEGGAISLRIEDDGVGVPEGFDVARDGKIGLQSIVGLCASQLKGKVSFNMTRGFSCEIGFSDNLYSARV
ncbi:MAG: PAS domain S-box protein [Spirochaetota bacterium]